MTRHLLVPGRGIPRPEHWQQRWADAHPEYRWAPEPPGPPLVLSARVAALHAAITESDEPAVLIAHSAGCITTAMWAANHAGPVHAALLVTPPDIAGYEPDDPSDIPWALPRSKLPFRTVLVASRTDPYTTFVRFEQFANDWGAELVDAGDVGHLDTASGFWPGLRSSRTNPSPGTGPAGVLASSA